MSLVVTTEAAKVRRMCGSPDTTELSTTDLNAFITEDALDWINERRPGKAFVSFETVSAQQDYDVKPSNARHITDVWWGEASWLTFSPSMQVVPGAFDIDDQMAGISVFDNAAIVVAFYKKVNHYNDEFKGKGVETATGLVRLMPVPTSSGDTVWAEFTYNRWSVVAGISPTTLDVANEYVEAMRFYAASMVMQQLALKRGVITGGRDWSGGAGSNETVAMNKFKTEANALAPMMPIISLG